MRRWLVLLAISGCGLDEWPGPEMHAEPSAEIGAVRALGVGRQNACVVTQTGDLWCWGDNGYGQTGDEPMTVFWSDRGKHNSQITTAMDVAVTDNRIGLVAGNAGHGVVYTAQTGLTAQGVDRADRGRRPGPAGVPGLPIAAGAAVAARDCGLDRVGENTAGAGAPGPAARILEHLVAAAVCHLLGPGLPPSLLPSPSSAKGRAACGRGRTSLRMHRPRRDGVTEVPQGPETPAGAFDSPPRPAIERRFRSPTILPRRGPHKTWT